MPIRSLPLLLDTNVVLDVTRNPKDFKGAPVDLRSAGELLPLLAAPPGPPG